MFMTMSMYNMRCQYDFPLPKSSINLWQISRLFWPDLIPFRRQVTKLALALSLTGWTLYEISAKTRRELRRNWWELERVLNFELKRVWISSWKYFEMKITLKYSERKFQVSSWIQVELWSWNYSHYDLSLIWITLQLLILNLHTHFNLISTWF